MSTKPHSSRIPSIDALRGFDMLWILGLESGVRALLSRIAPDFPPAQFVSNQLTHAAWDGLHFYDLIFPLFIFISGTSLAISLENRSSTTTKANLASQLLLRGTILFLLGVIFNGGLRDGLDKVRWLGVLQRIALATTLTGLLSLVLKPKTLATVGAGILVGYSIILLVTPHPDLGTTSFEEGKNIVNWFDQHFLPGRKHNGNHDPEGLLSTFPAIVSAIAGYLAGLHIMKTNNRSHVRSFLVIGSVSLVAGLALHPFVPIIKKLWTPSFVLATTGLSLLLLSAFSAWLDGRQQPRWTAPFHWVGSNPITLYLLAGLGLFKTVAERLTGNTHQPLGWMIPITSLLLVLALAKWLHSKQIRIRV